MICIEHKKLSELATDACDVRVPLEEDSSTYKRLRRSIEEFGLVQLPVWNETTGHVIAGRQRLGVLRDLGQTTIEVVVVSLPVEREQALSLALNNEELQSDWDMERLIDMVRNLRNTPEVDATLTGFEERQLRELAFEADPSFTPEDESGAPRIVRVALEFSGADWERARRDLDALVARHRPELHVEERTGRKQGT